MAEQLIDYSVKIPLLSHRFNPTLLRAAAGPSEPPVAAPWPSAHPNAAPLSPLTSKRLACGDMFALVKVASCAAAQADSSPRSQGAVQLAQRVKEFQNKGYLDAGAQCISLPPRAMQLALRTYRRHSSRFVVFRVVVLPSCVPCRRAELYKKTSSWTRQC